MEPSTMEVSNAIRLTGRQWIGLGLFMAAVYLIVPAVWPRVEKFELEPDYRIPYDLSADYWLYQRHARVAAARYETLVVGDSVVWGQYVTRDQTLTHYLNLQAGGERFANLGLDGSHPAALAGLLEHYGAALSGKNVILHCNPLWMSSSKHDLRGEEEFRFNHAALVPQFSPRIPCYREDTSDRLKIVIERNVPFESWTNHLQHAYFEHNSIPAWMLDHPYENPLAAVTLAVPPSDNQLRHEPISWTEKGIRKQEFAWVGLDGSFQWRMFRRAVEILQARGNRVFVILGPFNEHMLTESSLGRYKTLVGGIEAWLREKKVPCVVPEVLPTEQYADASHPLREGYALLARRLFESEAVRVSLLDPASLK
jgi:hypothetical protein